MLAPFPTTADPATGPSHGADIAFYTQKLAAAHQAIHQLSEGNPAGFDAGNALVTELNEHLLNTPTTLALARLAKAARYDELHSIHALNTCMLALVVGQTLQLNGDELQTLGLAALLHDVGEYHLHTKQRYEPALFTAVERRTLAEHPRKGQQLLQDISGLANRVGAILLQHHEHLDGSGYPDRLHREHIHPSATILRAVDEYLYLINHADRAKRRSPHHALSELYLARKQQFAQPVVTALVRTLSVYPPGTLVELSDGAVGMVVRMHESERLRPVVAIYQEEKQDVSPYQVDLIEDRRRSVIRALQPIDVSPSVLHRVQADEVIHYLLQR